MKFSLLFSLLILSGFAHASPLPGGAFLLEKGSMGCPSRLELLPDEKCQGFVMKSLNEKTETELCNINNGKFIKRWSEEGIDFRAESKTVQQSNLLLSTQAVSAKKAGKVVRESRTDLTLFFRAGRLDLQKTTKSKSLSCLYGRDPGLSLSAGNSKD